MSIDQILQQTSHRPWELPPNQWKYYQEWNNAIFLHWQVDYDLLRTMVPEALEIVLYQGQPWVSLVAFTMEKIRPKNLPAFAPISNFNEINIRTYVKRKNKTGVYFLSIEGGKRLSCSIAKKMSALPYRYSKMKRLNNCYISQNRQYKDQFEIQFAVGDPLNHKTALDQWLTERYALFQDSKNIISTFEIHHVEWPIYDIKIEHLKFSYPRFKALIHGSPDIAHHSPGVQVLAWDQNNTY